MSPSGAPTGLELQVNGGRYRVQAGLDETLLDVLRRELKLFGVREGCGIGMCGACTVLVDNKPMSSCLMLAALATNNEIVTIEGLADADVLHPIQQAFIDHTAFQCSYCTPGFILMTKVLLEERPALSVEEIREYLAGNLCRCGSYVKIVDAVLDAAERLRNPGGSSAT